jgi:hypothetical protein
MLAAAFSRAGARVHAGLPPPAYDTGVRLATSLFTI